MSPCFARRQGLVCSFGFFRGAPRKRSFPAFFVQKIDRGFSYRKTPPNRRGSFGFRVLCRGCFFAYFYLFSFVFSLTLGTTPLFVDRAEKENQTFPTIGEKANPENGISRKKNHGRGDAKQRPFRGFCGFYGKPSMVRGHVFMGTRRTCGSHGSRRRMSASALRCFLARGDLRLCALRLRTFLTEKRQTGEEETAGGRGRFGGVGSVGEAGDQRG